MFHIDHYYSTRPMTIQGRNCKITASSRPSKFDDSTAAAGPECHRPTGCTSWTIWSRECDPQKPALYSWLPIEQRIVFKLCVLIHLVHICLVPFISESASLHQPTSLHDPPASAIWTAVHTSEVRWTFVLVCRTKSLEQSPVFTARTHRHENFKRKLKTIMFISLNLCSFIGFVLFLFYFSTHHVIRWSILLCKRNSLWTMNYLQNCDNPPCGLVQPQSFQCLEMPCTDDDDDVIIDQKPSTTRTASADITSPENRSPEFLGSHKSADTARSFSYEDAVRPPTPPPPLPEYDQPPAVPPKEVRYMVLWLVLL